MTTLGAPRWTSRVGTSLRTDPSGDVIGGLRLFIPAWQDEDSLVFFDIRGNFFEDGGRQGSLGMGYRQIIPGGIFGQEAYVGINGFIDVLNSDNGQVYTQGTLGAELSTERFDVFANVYKADGKVNLIGSQVVNTIGLSQTRIVRQTGTLDTFEQALSGYDFGGSLKFPIGDSALLRLNSTYFDFGSGIADSHGYSAGFGLDFDRPFGIEGGRLSLGAEFIDDNQRGNDTVGFLRLDIPIGQTRNRSGSSRRLNAIDREITRGAPRRDTMFMDTRTVPNITETQLTDAPTGEGLNAFFVAESALGAGDCTGVGEACTVAAAEAAAGAGDIFVLVDDAGAITSVITLGGDRQQVVGGGTTGTANVVLSDIDSSVLTLTGLGDQPSIGGIDINGNDTATIFGLTTTGNPGITGDGFSGTVTIRDVTTTGGGISLTNANGAVVVIADSMIDGGTGPAILATSATPGGLLIDIDNTSVSTMGAGFAIDVSGGDSADVIVIGFADNTVTGTGGVRFDNVTFDADGNPANGIGSVDGGATSIGESGSPVTGDGLRLNEVLGDIAFDTLDITNDSGTGLFVRDDAGKGGSFALGTSGGTITTTGGTAVDIDPVALDMTLDEVNASGGTHGVLLDTVTGTFNVDGGTITGTTTAGLAITNSSVNSNFGATITNSAGQSLSFTNNSGGTVNVTGAIEDTGTGIDISNNTGGTLTVSDATVGTVADPMTGTSVNIDGNTGGTFTFDSLSTRNTSGVGLFVNNNSAGVAVTVDDGTIAKDNGAGPPDDAVLIFGGAPTVSIAADIEKMGDGGAAAVVFNTTGGAVEFSGDITQTGAAPTAIALNTNAGSVSFTGSMIDLTGGGILLVNNTGTVSFGADTTVNIADVPNDGVQITDNPGAVAFMGPLNIDLGATAGTSGIDITGTNGAIGLADVTITDVGAGAMQTGIDLSGATLTGAFTASSVTISGPATSTDSIGVNLTALMGNQTVQLGEQDPGGASSSITGLHRGVVIDPTAAVQFTFGDGEDGTDTGSVIDVNGLAGSFTVDAGAGTLPASSFNFLDVAPGAGDAPNFPLSPVNPVFVSTGGGLITAGTNGLSRDVNTISVADAEAQADTDQSFVFVGDAAGRIDTAGGGADGFTLDDGQNILGFNGPTPIGVGLLQPANITGNLGPVGGTITSNAVTAETSGGNTVLTLGGGSTVEGFDVDASGATLNGIAIAGAATDTTLNNISVTSTGGAVNAIRIETSGGNIALNDVDVATDQTAVNLFNNTGDVTFDANSSLNSTGTSLVSGLDITNQAGTVTFDGDVTVNNGGVGILLGGNAGGTINFNGGLDIDTTTGTGFLALGGGTINVANGTVTNTVDTTGGIAVSLNGVTIGGDGITFNSISSTNSPTDGIELTGVLGGTFSVTGATTVTNAAEAGIDIEGTNSATFTFADITINDVGTTADQTGIDFSGATQSSPFTATSVAISGPATSTDSIGVNLTGLMGNATVQLGDQVATGASSTITGLHRGVVIDSTASVQFTFGDGEDTTDQGSVIDVNGLAGSFTVDAGAGTLPGSSFDFRDVTIGAGDPANFPAPLTPVFVSTSGGLITAGTNGLSEDVNTISVADAVAQADTDQTFVFVGDATGRIDTAGGGAGGFTLDDGQNILGFNGPTPISVGLIQPVNILGNLGPVGGTITSNVVTAETSGSNAVLTLGGGSVVEGFDVDGSDAALDAIQIESAGANTTLNNISLTSTGGPSTGIRVQNSSGNVTFNDVDVTVDQNAVTLSNNTGDITFDEDSSLTSTGGSVSAGLVVTNQSGGTVTFNDRITVTNSGTGNGVDLSSNTGSAIRFEGGLDITTSTGIAFAATGGGTIFVDDPAGATEAALTATAGQALNLDGITIAADGMEFSDIRSTDAPDDAISINNVHGGTFSIAAGDDVIITNPGGDGIDISNSSATFNFAGAPPTAPSTVTITDAGGNGILLSANTGPVSFGMTTVTNPGVSGINIDGSNSGAITFSDLDIALQTDGTTGFDVNGAVLNANVTVTDFDLTSTTATGTTGVDLRGVTGTGTVTLGDTVSPFGTGADASIAGVATGVILSDASDIAFVFGDGEGTTDTGSSIAATLAIDFTDATGANGTFNFLDVSFPTAGSITNLEGVTVFVFDNVNTSGAGTFDDPGSVTEADASTADALIVIDSTNNGISDDVNIGTGTLQLADGQVLVSLTRGESIDLATLGVVAGGAPANLLLTGIDTSTIVTAPNTTAVDTVHATLTSSNSGAASGTVTFAGSGTILNAVIENTSGTGNAVQASLGTAEDIVIRNATISNTAAGGFTAINIATTAGASTFTFSDLTVNGQMLLNGTAGGTLTVTGTGTNTVSNTTNGQAIDFDTVVIGAGGVSFSSVTATGGFNGIEFRNTSNGKVTIDEATVTGATVGLRIESTSNDFDIGLGAGGLVIDGGTLGIGIFSTTGGTINLGTGATSGGVQIGTTTATGGDAIGINSAAGTINIGNSTTPSALSGGNTSSAARAVRITNSDADITMTSLDINEAGSGVNGDGIGVFDNNAAGSFTLNGTSTIDNVGGDGISVFGASVDISGVTIGGTAAPGLAGVTIGDGGQAITVALDNITVTNATGTGISIIGTGAGSVTVTSFSNNTVTDAGAGGVVFNTVTFDGDTGTAGNQDVNFGTLSLGTSGNRVEGKGLSFINPTGRVAIGTLNVFNNGNTGLEVNTKGAGTTFNLDVTTGTVDTTNGTALFLDPLTGNVALTTVNSTGAGANGGVFIDQFDAEGGATDTALSIATLSVTGSTGDAIQIIDSTGTFNFGTTTIDNTASSGGGVDIDGTAADTLNVNFTGSLNVSTGTGTAFDAQATASTTTVTVSGGANVLNTTTGTALQLQNIVIGGANMAFANVSTTNSADPIDINILSGGSLTITGGNLANVSGTGVDLNAISNTVSIGTSITTTATGRSVDVTGSGGLPPNTITFSGAITDNGTGIVLSNNDQNSGATITFTGPLTLNTGRNTAFSATDGGTVNVTNANNTVTTTTGTGVNIQNTTIGASGVTFRSVSVNGATNGIVLNATGTTGAFSVTGTGTTDGSGGTIQNTTGGDGVSLTNVSNVTLSNMNIQNTGAHGIDGTNVTNLDLNNLTITSAGNASGEHGIFISGLFGTSAASTDSVFNDVTITGETTNGSNGIRVFSSNTSPATAGELTIQNSLVQQNGSFGILVSANGANSTFTVTIDNTTVRNNAGGGIRLTATGANSTLNASVLNSVLSGTATTTQTFGISALAGISGLPSATGTVNLIADNNDITTDGAAFNAFPFGQSVGVHLQTDGAGSMNARVSNNTIISNDPARSVDSNRASGVFVDQDSTGNMRVEILGNTITIVDGEGIAVEDNSGSGGGRVDVTVTNNSVDTTGSDFSTTGLTVDRDSTGNICVDVANNDFTVGVPPHGNADIQLDNQNGTGTFSVVQLGFGGSDPGPFDASANTSLVETSINAAQTAMPTGTQVDSSSAGFVGAIACTLSGL